MPYATGSYQSRPACYGALAPARSTGVRVDGVRDGKEPGLGSGATVWSDTRQTCYPIGSLLSP